MKHTSKFTFVLFTALALVGALCASAGELTPVDVSASSITWQTDSLANGYHLSVSGPEGVFEYSFAAGETPSFSVFNSDGYTLADGNYTWELRAIPVLSRADRAAMSKARAAGEQLNVVPQAAAQYGYATVQGGVFVSGGEEAVADRPQAPVTRDQVFVDDLIVDGSACIGQDCANGENFGFDTLRLKENNLRIKFDDTSSSGSFPNNDWQLTANDSGNGGANKFSLDDITGGKTPFTVEAGAPSNSLYVDDAGNIGVGKSTPVVEVHITDGDSPTIRLEQDGSSGFTSQTWDLAGNETNFFVRDVTNGSKLPFKIIPNAPTNSLYVAASGNIGLGTASPDAGGAHIIGAVLIEETSDSGSAPAELLQINSDADNGARIRFDDGNKWNMGGGTSSTFIISEAGNATQFELDSSGNLTITGTLTDASDVNLKENFSSINPKQVLGQVVALPITTWNYKSDDDTVRHIGPMSQDFFATFGLGGTETGIAPRNLAAVSMAAIQGLNELVEEKDAALESLQQENASLAARLAALEALVNGMVQGQ